jgi:hypothetical protein
VKRTRSQAGYFAKKVGDAFEELFKAACNRAQLVWIRVPNGAQLYKDKFGTLRTKLVQSPFDFLITANGLSAVVDCKTFEGNSLTYSQIKDHQLDALLKAGRSINSGYIVWFRELDAVVFFSAFRMNKLKEGQSLKFSDGLQLGSVSEFNPEMVLKWIDDGTTAEPNYQQRFF